MKRLNPEYVRAATKLVNGNPYFNLLSMEMKGFELESCTMEVEIQKKHLQNFGIVHGGVCSSLVDAAAFWAVYPQIEEGLGMITVELKINFLARAMSGYLKARGKSIKVGNTICLGEATVENNQGRLLAHGTSTMMVLKDLGIKGSERFPPKFLD